MVALRVGEEWVDEVDGMKAEVKRHFEELFSESELNRPVLDGISFLQISDGDNAGL